MNIDIGLSKDFETALDDMNRKYGEDFELLNGFHTSQLNFSEFMDGFVSKNVADATIDSNANAHFKDICSLTHERGKAQDKLFCFNKLFDKMKEKYGLRTAREWLEAEYSGAYYMHDAPSCTMKPYCYAYDLTRLATEGLFFVPDYNNQPPKHLTTFLDDVIEFMSWVSNRSSGACGLPNLLIWTYYFWKHDVETGFYIKDPDYYIRQCFQKFVYRANGCFLRTVEAVFSNVSFFDREYLVALFGGVQFPDGSYVIDQIEEIIEHQKVFMEVVSSIRTENMFTFPVMTVSLLYKDGKFVDEEFARWASDWNSVWNESNFFVSDNVGTLSNCPMSADTEIRWWDYDGNEHIDHIADLVNQDINVASYGMVVKARVNKHSIPIRYEIILEDGRKLHTTPNHLNVTDKATDVMTANLNVGDSLMVSDKYGKGVSYIKITEVNRIEGDSVSYCIEIQDDAEPVFTLANGIVTHNCRLLSDTRKLKGFINSIGGTALSIGSVKVNTINLMRIAYESAKDIGKYLEILKDRTELCCKVLDVQRNIIKRNIEKNLLPNYCDGAVELDKQYSTVGVA